LKWHDFIKDYLAFTRKERIAMLIIAGLILFVLFLPDMLPNKSKNKLALLDTAWAEAVKKLEIKIEDSSNDSNQYSDNENANAYQWDKRKSSYNESETPKGELFYFNPNTISNSDWKRLGLRDKTIQTIEKYISNGGHFYKPADLQKIYGLKTEEYARLKPYIRIESKTTSTNEHFVLLKPKDELKRARSYTASYSVIDINSADTSGFISLPGIGSKLALRIVNFRDKLGGFYSVDQVGETYGLPDSTFQKIKQYLKLDNASVKKININSATIDEMKAHPYFKYSLANPIVAYRNEHGPFSKIEDIKKVMAVTDEVYNKISPYLIVQ